MNDTFDRRDPQVVAFATTLNAALVQRSWIQATLAAKVGVSGPTISNWVRGRYVPRPPEVFAIERALRMAPGSLSIHLGYLPASASSFLGRLANQLLTTAEGAELLVELAGPTLPTAATHAA